MITRTGELLLVLLLLLLPVLFVLTTSCGATKKESDLALDELFQDRGGLLLLLCIVLLVPITSCDATKKESDLDRDGGTTREDKDDEVDDSYDRDDGTCNKEFVLSFPLLSLFLLLLLPVLLLLMLPCLRTLSAATKIFCHGGAAAAAATEAVEDNTSFDDDDDDDDDDGCCWVSLVLLVRNIFDDKGIEWDVFDR